MARVLDKTGKLTDKQAAFVTAYFECGYNGTAAAIKAGYSPASARQIATENLSKPAIRAALEERAKTHGLTEDGVYRELAGIAVGTDMADLQSLMPGVDFAKLQAAGLDTRNIREIDVIAEAGVDGGGNPVPAMKVKVKLPDRMAALVHCGRALMMFGDKRDVRVTTEHRQASDQEVMDTMQVIIERAKARGLERSQKLLE